MRLCIIFSMSFKKQDINEIGLKLLLPPDLRIRTTSDSLFWEEAMFEKRVIYFKKLYILRLIITFMERIEII